MSRSDGFVIINKNALSRKKENMLRNLYDVIVIGGGPAGSTAAYILSKQGLDVLVIDKDNFPRPKLCGGLLTYKTLEILKRVYGDSIEALQNAGVINYLTYSYELRTAKMILQSGVTAVPAALVDRSVYDNYLLSRAIGTGTQILNGDRVTNIDKDNRIVGTLSGKKFKAKVIIGADGANSVVRKTFTNIIFDVKKWTKNLATGLEVTIPRKSAGVDVTGPVIYLDIVPWGYGWVFPNENNLVVGVGCLFPRRNNLKESLNSLLASINFKGPTPKPLGHPIPYGNYLKSPANGSILLIGDAAGFVDPMMGEGIYYAHRSAEIAANSIIEAYRPNSEDFLATIYIQSIRKEIISELRAIKNFRWLIFSAMDLFGISALKFMIRIIGVQRFSELVHGIRSYQWKKGGIYEKRRI